MVHICCVPNSGAASSEKLKLYLNDMVWAPAHFLVLSLIAPHVKTTACVRSTCWIFHGRKIHWPYFMEPTKLEGICCTAVTQLVYKHTLRRMPPLNCDTAFVPANKSLVSTGFTVQFGLVQCRMHFLAFPQSKGYQITVPCRTYFGHPFLGVPSSPKASQEELQTLLSADCKLAKSCF